MGNSITGDVSNGRMQVYVFSIFADVSRRATSEKIGREKIYASKKKRYLTT